MVDKVEAAELERLSAMAIVPTVAAMVQELAETILSGGSVDDVAVNFPDRPLSAPSTKKAKRVKKAALTKPFSSIKRDKLKRKRVPADQNAAMEHFAGASAVPPFLNTRSGASADPTANGKQKSNTGVPQRRKRTKVTPRIKSSVCVLWEGQRYGAKITKRHASGKFDVLFDDGETGWYVSGTCLSSPRVNRTTQTQQKKMTIFFSVFF